MHRAVTLDKLKLIVDLKICDTLTHDHFDEDIYI